MESKDASGSKTPCCRGVFAFFGRVQPERERRARDAFYLGKTGWLLDDPAEGFRRQPGLFIVCPRVTLLEDNGQFCGICSPQKGLEHCNKHEKTMTWRKTWGSFLAECDEITAFSNDSAHLLLRAYPELQNVKVIPHCVDPLRPVYPHKKGKLLTIGVIGAISEGKGLKILMQMAEIIQKEKLPVRITIIGYTAYDPGYGNIISCTGRYERDELPEIVEKNGIYIVLIPSVWPETFSYTAEESMMMGLPVAVFNLGAPAERVKEYEKGIIINEISADAALEGIYNYWIHSD